MKYHLLPLLAGIFSTGLLLASPAFGWTDSQKCAAFKWKAAGTYARCLLRADAKAVKSGRLARYDKCERELTLRYTRADLQWACDFEGEVTNVLDLVGTCTETVRTRNATEGPGIVAIEEGWKCSGPAPGGCTPVCGDGLVVAEDDCDADAAETCSTGFQVAFGDGFTVCGTSSDQKNTSPNRFSPQLLSSAAPGAPRGDCSSLPLPAPGDPKVYRYLNIPYGDAYEPHPDKPYSNKKRWTPAAKWNPDTSHSRTSKSIDGTIWGPACLQTGRAKIEPKACLALPAGTPPPGPLPTPPDYIGAEDCLTLNVYTPAPPDDTSGQLKPVVVWIHGGNYMRGTANSCSFEGTLFASRQDVVVVTVNYRLGVLGFLGNFGDADSKMGNFGLRDQRLSLEWVQDNIESFGGDPERVTIWGESAGASSVGVHLASSGSHPYFKQAMMDSNHYGMRFATHEMAERRAAALIDGVLEESSSDKASLCLSTLPCRDKCPLALTQEAKIQCLRECHSGKVLNDANRRTMQIPALLNQGLGGAQYWGPMVETAETTPPSRAWMVEGQPIDSGSKTLDHAILVGTNGSEGANVKLGLAPGRTPPTAKSIYQGSMYAAFGIIAPRRTLANKIFKTQLGDEETDPPAAVYASLASQLITDYNFGCATEHVLRDRVTSTVESPGARPATYAYYFNVTQPTINFLEYSDPHNICQEEACHGNELPYVWGNPCVFEGVCDPDGFNGREEEFALQLGDYLGTFIWTGNPGWGGEPSEWDEFTYDASQGGGAYLHMSGQFAAAQDSQGPAFSMLDTGLGGPASPGTWPAEQCTQLYTPANSSNWEAVGWAAKTEEEKHAPHGEKPFGPKL